MVKNPLAKKKNPLAGDTISIPESGGSPGGGNGVPPQYSCLGNPMDRGAWRAIQPMGLQKAGHDLATENRVYGCTGS